MGVWGPNLYQNDVGEDVKDDYKMKLMQGKTDEDALVEILCEYEDVQKDDDEKYDFWFALADTMWKFGRLTEEVKKQALHLISKEDREWSHIKERKKREKVLEDLKIRLLSDMPPRKKISIHKPYIIPWKEKDVYVYQIKNPPKDKMEYLGWYITIYVHDLSKHEFVVRGVYDIVPDIYIMLSKEEPVSPNQINELTLVCGIINVYNGRKDKPGDGKRHYRYTLMETSNRKYPKGIKYLGQCDNFVYPENEASYNSDLHMGCQWWCIENDAIRGYELELYGWKEGDPR
ncbi:hypothetical protein [Pseudobacteroides cellulosolvens]|uniref:Uncharacterized protein n=1 Tax=Pseudobacteroides cellulosolvens ATCC 35603 = DSM 2933 TaxID=398512 RepID=A0A0L6JM63_9FIRM|nr:hypothetical protein [Pseudobacteroides cellulosolvens]KNY26492.1 hypothetical protein Bccel_1757 [Pseudobacteroides cellulosolvens ATCC 35603 = DSM 2933]